jgi:hypothetical protein
MFLSLHSHNTHLIVDHLSQGITFNVVIEVLPSYLTVMSSPHDIPSPLELDVFFSSQTKFRDSIDQGFHKEYFLVESFLYQYINANYQS